MGETPVPYVWAERALRACLLHLAEGIATADWCIVVSDSWTEGDYAFCVVYKRSDFDGPIGLRRTAVDDEHDGRFCGNSGRDLAEPPDPVTFGEDVADFDIGEPLGTVANKLQPDQHGVHWWGSPPVS